MSSPSERYSAAIARVADSKTRLHQFRTRLEFQLDDFQIESCRALEEGRGVLVAAPTGAGKTVVGEFAVYLALERGLKAFYTTPIKALSNQKYAELVNVYGPDRVGLLTGDTSINSEADVVVMTTEVLRNMLYADSATLTDLAYVVMDEVHYLADRFRGAVWEEVIIHLPSQVQLVSLSATVSNAEEFGAWLDTVRGDTAVVVTEHRPVPLWQHIMVGSEIFDLFASDVAFDEMAPQLERAKDLKEFAVNPELLSLARAETQALSRGGYQRGFNQRGRGQRRAGGRGRNNFPEPDNQMRRTRRATRPQIIKRLDNEGLLPAITFIFSRAGCDAAVQQCVDSGLWLTTEEERRLIAQRVDEASQDIPEDDLEVLGFWTWRQGLVRGFAAHHAGMLPTFKEVVEKLFAGGYVKAVFATETLALGVNMPARSVVLEKLDKFNGEAHVDITAGEYTQLTGRAGRRGIDIEGHAVVLWQPGTDPTAVAGLASRRTYPLNSSFRPTYNMSINLIAQFGRGRASDILESSFAQFQADRSVVGIAKQVRSREESLAGYERSMSCHLGDFAEYSRLRREVSDTENQAAKNTSRHRRSAAADSLERLRPGDVIDVPAGRNPGYAVVLSTDQSSREPRPTILTLEKHLRRVSVQDLTGPVEPISRIRIPKSFNAQVPKDRRDLASSLRNALHERRPPRRSHSVDFEYAGTLAQEEKITALRAKLRAHPCHGCADREEHARWAERWWKLRRDTDGLIRQIQGRTNTIAKIFDRVCDVLEHYGYITDATAAPDDAGSALGEAPGALNDASEEPGTPTPAPPAARDDAAEPAASALRAGSGEQQLSPSGQRLRRIYGEKDLLVALSLESGAFEDLDGAELAAFITVLVYQAKREEQGVRPRMPSVSLETAVDIVVRQWSELTDVEQAHKLPLTGEPELGLVWPMYKWARGAHLQAALSGTELAAGDFVRWAKQVIDLLDQLAQVQPLSPELRRRCIQAIALVRRGVVAYSAVAA